MIKWRSAICLFRPDLEDALDIHEAYHRGHHQYLLWVIDNCITSGRSLEAAKWLTVCYNGVIAMEHTPLVDVPVKEFILSSATNHLLHLYRSLLPASPIRETSSRQNEMIDLLVFFMSFPRTSKLLPARYQSTPENHRALIRVLQLGKRWETAKTDSQGSTKQTERSSAPNAYLPAEFIATFGLTTEESALYEKTAQSSLLKCPDSLRTEALELSPWTISVAFRAYLDEFDITTGPASNKQFVAVKVLMDSFYIWDLIGKYWTLCFRAYMMKDRAGLEADLIALLARDPLGHYKKYDKLKRRRKNSS